MQKAVVVQIKEFNLANRISVGIRYLVQMVAALTNFCMKPKNV